MRHLKGKMKSRSAFTMTELLIAVAVLAILVGIAIPGVLALRENLRLAELDSSARSIFSAAQNRLSELNAAGMLADLGGEEVNAKPIDFPDGFAWETGRYRYLASEDLDGAMELLLPEGTLESKLASNYYIVEYCPDTGTVYAVFYAEEPLQHAYETHTLELLRGEEQKNARKKSDLPFGYYGGSAIEYSEIDVTAPAAFEIVNADELYIEVRPGGVTGTQYEVLVQDAHGGARTFFFTEGDINLLAGVRYVWSDEEGGYVYRILLDSMEQGSRFRDICYDLSPGDNLKISLKATYQSELPTTVYANVSSLFAQRDANDCALLTNPRHLQNLDETHSGMESAPTAAVLGAHIAWPAARNFTSIQNAALRQFDGHGNTISGLNAALFAHIAGESAAKMAEVKNLHLTNFAINASGDAVGTVANSAEFAAFSRCYVHADTLTGDVSETTAVLNARGAAYTGGLVGLATDCTIQNSFAALTRIEADTGAVGGLLGGAVNSTLEACYAATGYYLAPEDAAEEGAWHEESGIFAAEGTVAGGIAGRVSGGEIARSYAVGNIAAASHASGFAGASENSASYYSAYAAVTYEQSAENAAIYGFTNAAAGASCHYLAVQTFEKVTTSAQPCTYEDLLRCMDGVSDWGAASASTTHGYGRADEIYPLARLNTLPHYGDWPAGGAYMLDYGMWYYERYDDGTYGFFTTTQKGAEMGALSNSRTIVEDGYAIISESAAPGQAMDVRYYGNNNSYGKYPSNHLLGTLTAQACTLFEPFKNEDEEDTTEVVAYLIDHTVLVNAIFRNWRDGQTAFYCAVETPDGNKLYFLPHFAKGAVYEANAGIEKNASGYPRGLSGAEMTYEIRTPRQLYMLSYLTRNLSDMGYSFHGATYIQTRDIDFTSYERLYPMQSMFTYRALSGSYDGRGYSITGFDLDGTGDAYTGLFARVSGGAVRNVVFKSDRGAENPRTIKGGDNVGGLIGYYLAGTYRANIVENCRVEGFAISGNQNVGGFMGKFSATASIVNSVTSGCAVTGADNVGGFVGAIDNLSHYNAGTIKQCAAVNASFTAGAGGSLTLTSTDGNGGAFAGFANKGTISDCYAVVTAGAASERISGFIAEVDIEGLTVSRRTKILDSYCIVRDGSGAYLDFTAPNAVLTRCMAFDGENQAQMNTAFAENALWGRADEANTHPYAALTGEYPFPAVLKDLNGKYVHYGNWPGDAEEGFLVYFERYEDDETYYLDLRNSAMGQAVSNLKDAETVTLDGYAVLVAQGSAVPAMTWDSGAGDAAVPPDGTTYLDTLSLEGRRFDLYAIDDGVISAAAAARYYTKLSVGGRVYWYNPDFAASICTGASLPSAPETTYLRSARQLAHLSRRTNSGYWGGSFEQELDIDFAAYETQQLLLPIGYAAAAFSGVYDGGGHIITGIGIDTTALSAAERENTGLFGYGDACQIRNVTFLSDPDGIVVREIKGEGKVGGFIGELHAGTVENCVVAGFKISGTGTYVGGFAGFAGKDNSAGEMYIKNCAAVNYTLAGSGGSVSGTSNVGGFVGYAKQKSKHIENCYAVATVSGSSNVGGFVGQTQAGPDIQNNYCIAQTASGSALGFGYNGVNCLAYDATDASAEAIRSTFSAWGTPTREHSSPFATALIWQRYSYPSPVTRDDAPVHYGNWPMTRDALWTSGAVFTAGDIIEYNGQWYYCVQGHTAQPGWTPNYLSSLWAKLSDPNEAWPAWLQYTSPFTPYMIGAKVTYGGKRWICTVDNNYFAPGAYGWDEVH